MPGELDTKIHDPIAEILARQEKGQKAEVGDTVVFGFRAQMFVTRAYVAAVSGISKGRPKVEGIYFTDGRKVGWPEW